MTLDQKFYCFSIIFWCFFTWCYSFNTMVFCSRIFVILEFFWFRKSRCRIRKWNFFFVWKDVPKNLKKFVQLNFYMENHMGLLIEQNFLICLCFFKFSIFWKIEKFSFSNSPCKNFSTWIKKFYCFSISFWCSLTWCCCCWCNFWWSDGVFPSCKREIFIFWKKSSFKIFSHRPTASLHSLPVNLNLKFVDFNWI